MSWDARNAEYARLAAEMAEDARWQLQLFTFGVTASPIILTASKLWFDADYNRNELPVPGGLFFLAPLLILVPTSLIILNRARTRNRKAAFVVAFLDPLRLGDAKDTADRCLNATLKESAVPWETALLVIERAFPSEKKKRDGWIWRVLKRIGWIGQALKLIEWIERVQKGNGKIRRFLSFLGLPGFRRAVHLPPAVVAMIGSYFAIEAVCWFLAYRALSGLTRPEQLGMKLVAGLLFLLRLILLLRLGSHDSIQECVIRWVTRATRFGWKRPKYLADWGESYDEHAWDEALRSSSPRGASEEDVADGTADSGEGRELRSQAPL